MELWAVELDVPVVVSNVGKSVMSSLFIFSFFAFSEIMSDLPIGSKRNCESLTLCCCPPSLVTMYHLGSGCMTFAICSLVPTPETEISSCPDDEVEDDVVNGRDVGPNKSSVGLVPTRPHVTVTPARLLSLDFFADGSGYSSARVASSPGTTSPGGDTFGDLAGGLADSGMVVIFGTFASEPTVVDATLALGADPNLLCAMG
jgi:hypothetical protein